MAEVIGLVSEVSAALSIFYRITQEIRRLRIATTEVSVLEQVQVEIDQTTQCLELVKMNGSLQVADFEPSIVKLEELAERLKNALDELNGETKRRQKFWQRLKLGSSNRMVIDDIMQDMRRVRLDLLVQLQLSLVGIHHEIHDAVQVGADALKTMDEQLKPLDGSFPKLAKLLETRKDDNGKISVSKEDIKELLDRQGFKLESDPEPGPSTPKRPNKTTPGEVEQGRDVNFTLKDNEAKGWILDDAEDSSSIYSDSTIPTLHEWGGRYETEIAASLFGSLSPILNDAEGVGRVTNALPRYLKAFARKLGAERQQRIYRDVMRHVHKYRGAISSRFQESADTQLQRQRRQSADTGEIIPYGEKVGDWLSGVSPDNLQEKVDNFAAIEGEDEKTDENEDEVIPLELGSYLTVVTTSAAYNWLLSKLRHELLFYVPGETNAHDMISNEVLSHPIFLRVSRDLGPPHCSVLYETDWNPLAFFREQKYHEGDYKYSEAEAFSRALTLTGVLDEAEALSCGEYICRTWPQSGKAFVQLMEMHLASEDERESQVTLQDGTELLVYPGRSRVSFKAAGQPDTVIELGEQLAWVSCAMRSSNIPNCASFRPFIEQTLKTGQTENSLDLVMQLRCREQALTEPPREDASGECWLQLFRNPVIVTGFPIPRRAQLHIGLEMDLATMGLLARGRRISTFNSYLLIKGYRTMLVAVKAVSNVVLWHVLTKEGGGDIEYHDPRVQQLKPQTDSMVPWSQLKNMKHVVGWCSHVKNNAGAVDANFDVIGSGLPPPGPDFVLERVNVGFSKYITLSASLAGIRGTPHRMDYSGMPLNERIKSIASQHVVLFDNEVKKGWLLDGASVMLHLLRASLVRDVELGQKLEHSHEELAMLDEERPLNPIQVLNDSTNLNLTLYALADEREIKTERKLQGEQAGDRAEVKEITTGTWYRVENRLDMLSDVLYEIFSHHSDMSTNGVGYKMKSLVKWRLEGFEWVDLVNRAPTVQTKYLELRKGGNGNGWVDFIRGLQAVTLFGSGFGEILEPLDPAIGNDTPNRTRPSPRPDIYDSWGEVPSGQEFLATTNSILRKISKEKGGTRFSRSNGLPTTKFWQLVPGIYLESPCGVFGSCNCGGTCSTDAKATRRPCNCCGRMCSTDGKPTRRSCNPVLGAVSETRRGKHDIKSLASFPDNGAVIFGCREPKVLYKDAAANGDRNKSHAKTEPKDEAASSQSNAAESSTTASRTDPSTVSSTQPSAISSGNSTNKGKAT